MKQLQHLIKHDFMLLLRNKIIAVSVVVSILYVLIFKAISDWGDVDKLLVLVIFNDPALLGFLFVGVMVLFEKNENTLQVLAVSPLKISNYILSKSITLTSIAIGCCFLMAFASKGCNFNFFHF